MAIKSIRQFEKGNFVEDYIARVKAKWYFEKWYEKLIMIIFGILGLWKLLNLIGLVTL